LIVLNPVLDSLCNSAFKNIGLTPGIPKGCFQHPQDAVIAIKRNSLICLGFTERLVSNEPIMDNR
jgi:hypothetical protein